MAISNPAEALQPVVAIMQRRGATCTPAEFHAAVNVTFHQFESEVYDQEHWDMWGSLPVQFDLFANDCLARPRKPAAPLRMLDIGCGTGLASQCILDSGFGPLIGSVDLLDTSSAMLGQALKRSADWKVPVQTFEGLLDDLPEGRQYDLIVTCSVLHHVPDLPGFTEHVRRLQAPGGFFIHLQDPNGDYSSDPELLERMERFSRKPLPEIFYRLTPGRIAGRLRRMITGEPPNTHTYKTNQALLRSGIVTSPLAISEIYAITDIHVADGQGISISQMQGWMPEYELVSMRTYGFFGVLWASLPPKLKSVEEELIRTRARNGFHVGAAWQLR